MHLELRKMGITEPMKRLLSAAAAAAIIITSAVPVFAQNQNDHRRTAPQFRHIPQRQAPRQRYRAGQNWHGHRLANRGGHWGYYQPRNGAQVFINIPL
jgi:hypothetical protein